MRISTISKDTAENKSKISSLAQAPRFPKITEDTFTDPTELVELTDYRFDKQRKCYIGVRDLNIM